MDTVIDEVAVRHAVAGTFATPGRALAAARESKGLTVMQVAESLRFSTKQIQLLERDDYGLLPGSTVVRGMVRNYARLVGLDAEPLLAELRQRIPTAPTVITRAMRVPVPRRSARGHRLYGVLSGLLALVGIAVVVDALITPREWFKRDAMAAREEISQPVSPLSLSAGTGVPDAAGGNASINAGSVLSTDLPGAAQATSGSGDQSAPPLPPDQRRIQLKFERESWVEIRMKDGELLYSRLNPAGSEKTLEGKPPFTLVIGAAAGVKLLYDEQPIDLTPHIKVDIARLTLK